MPGSGQHPRLHHPLPGLGNNPRGLGWGGVGCCATPLAKAQLVPRVPGQLAGSWEPGQVPPGVRVPARRQLRSPSSPGWVPAPLPFAGASGVLGALRGSFQGEAGDWDGDGAGAP